MEETYEFIVLDDGETYTAVDSARIIFVNEKGNEYLQDDGKIKHMTKEDGLLFVTHVPEPTMPMKEFDSWWDSII